MAEPLAALDPSKTFDSFVVGSANRLAAAAARRTAESPGTLYNPLFLYSHSGLGKSHILNAIALYLEGEGRDQEVRYLTLDGFVAELDGSILRGDADVVRRRYEDVDVLLLDDVQFIAGKTEAQELLTAMLSNLMGRGGQAILASDRAPTEIEGLDEKLRTRFAGGLIVDIGKPDYETRVAIVRTKVAERGATLSHGVPETLARLQFRNVRDLQGALNRVLADQDLKGRALSEAEVMGLMAELARDPRPIPSIGAAAAEALPDEAPGEKVTPSPAKPADADTAHSADDVDDPEEWRRAVKAVAATARSSSIEAEAVLALLEEAEPPTDWKDRLAAFRGKLERIGEIRAKLDRLENPWPEAAATFLTTTERMEEAENLLASALELRRPLLPLPDGPLLAHVKGRYPPLALKAAEQLIRGGPSPYNPLFVHSDEPRRALGLLRAAGRSFLELQPDRTVGSTSLSAFAEDFTRAMTEGVAGAWRERWWGIDLLLMHELEALSSSERAQDEVFHLLEAVTRRGGRVILAADRPPDAIDTVDARLLSRFQGGLVLDLGRSPGARASRPVAVDRPDAPPPESTPAPIDGSEVPAKETDTPPMTSPDGETAPADVVESSGGGDGPEEDLVALRALVGVGRFGGDTESVAAGGRTRIWLPSREKVVWEWPDVSALLADEPVSPGEGADDDD